MQLKIMTFNTQHCLNYLTREIDYEIMAKTILKQSPDIVSLNEMRDEGPMEGYDAQVKILSEKTDMRGYFAEAISFDGQNPYGNGLLTRFPILKTEVIPIPVPEVRPYSDWYEDRCLLKATLDIQGEALTVLVIHVGLNPDEAQRAIDTILANLPSERCILMGDFNLTPDSPILAPIFEKMQGSGTVKLYLDKRDLSRELESYMNEIASLTNTLKIVVADEDASSDFAPCARLCRADGTETGLAFHGVPGGHEFSSFVLGIYNAFGPGQPLTDKTRERIQMIDKPTDIKVLVSLTCTMCPDTVVSAQHIAAKNKNVTAEIYDIHHFEKIRLKYNVMSVPCILINDTSVSFGKKNVDQILDLIE